MFSKKKPWYSCGNIPLSKNGILPKRLDQIAWRNAVIELDNAKELPYQGGELILPQQNTFMCLSPNCDEPTYDEFCSSCKADAFYFNIKLIKDYSKDV